MFLARYAIAPCPWSSVRGFRSVDQLHGACTEVGIASVVRGALDSVPHDLREPARDRAAVAARGMAGDVEAHPADHVVRGVRSGAGEGVVDGDAQVRVHARLERG